MNWTLNLAKNWTTLPLYIGGHIATIHIYHVPQLQPHKKWWGGSFVLSERPQGPSCSLCQIFFPMKSSSLPASASIPPPTVAADTVTDVVGLRLPPSVASVASVRRVVSDAEEGVWSVILLLEGVDAVVLLAGSSVVGTLCVVASVVEGDSVEAASVLDDVGVVDTVVRGKALVE